MKALNEEIVRRSDIPSYKAYDKKGVSFGMVGA